MKSLSHNEQRQGGMVVVMQPGATEAQIQAVIERLNSYGFDVHRSTGVNQTVLGAIGVKPDFDIRHIKVLDGVADVYRVTEPYKFASRTWKKTDTQIEVNGVVIGGPEVVVMAGPCSVESEEQIMATAAHVAAQGATFLRGGAFKPRTSPYSFQGLGEVGLKLLREAADRYGLRVITEVMDVNQIELIYPYTDIFQVGARNMQNFALLKELGKVDKPVFLKRGPAATIEEWLMSAEYVIAHGNPQVILCERGIRTFETQTRNTLDLSAIPVVKQKSHLHRGRSQPRDGPARQGDPDGAGGRGGGRRWHHGGSPPRSAFGQKRRTAVALFRPVYRVDASDPAHCPGDRADGPRAALGNRLTRSRLPSECCRSGGEEVASLPGRQAFCRKGPRGTRPGF